MAAHPAFLERERSIRLVPPVPDCNDVSGNTTATFWAEKAISDLLTQHKQEFVQDAVLDRLSLLSLNVSRFDPYKKSIFTLIDAQNLRDLLKDLQGFLSQIRPLTNAKSPDPHVANLRKFASPQKEYDNEVAGLYDALRIYKIISRKILIEKSLSWKSARILRMVGENLDHRLSIFIKSMSKTQPVA